MRFAPGHLWGVEGDNSSERRGRKGQVARTCRADLEPKWRRALWNSGLHASAGWTGPGSDHLWHPFEERGDALRTKPVSYGFDRNYISRDHCRRDPHGNSRHDLTQLVDWAANERRIAQSPKTVIGYIQSPGKSQQHLVELMRAKAR